MPAIYRLIDLVYSATAQARSGCSGLLLLSGLFFFGTAQAEFAPLTQD